MEREVNTRKNIRVVTHNNFINAKGLARLSAKARKLLYLAISQCRLTDDEFCEYKITIPDFAKLMDIDKTNVYQEANNITGELMSCYFHAKVVNSNDFDDFHLFKLCKYREKSGIIFRLSDEITMFLLHLTDNFSKPLLADFMSMRSPYSMAIWHLMQREMKSKKPGQTEKIEFELSLKELRAVTGTEEILKGLSNFKERVLDKALREIYDNCGVSITYDNIKEGRTVIGFHFVAQNVIHTDIEDIKPLTKAKIKKLTKKLSERDKELMEGMSNGKYQIELVYNPPKGKKR